MRLIVLLFLLPVILLMFLAFTFLMKGGDETVVSPPSRVTPDTVNREIAVARSCGGRDALQMPCFNSSDCKYLCKESMVFCGQDGTCFTGTSEGGGTAPSELCNPKHGIVAVLLGNSATSTAEWACVSMYRYLFTDDDKLVDGVCQGGTFDVDFTLKEYSPTACLCPEGTGLIWNDSDPFNLAIPRCVKKPHLFRDFEKY